MKNLLFLLLAIFGISANAQYNAVNARLERLEAKERNVSLKDFDISNKKFVLIKDFDDHTERMFITVNGDQATFVEVFDDKATGETTSNIFTGDVVKTENNVLSFRFDMLEGKKVALPVAKNLLATKQKRVLYLVDVNTRERWIDESAINKK